MSLLLLLLILARPDDHCGHDLRNASDTRAPIGFDPASGRDLRVFPPSPVVDFLHMKLAIDISDMNSPRLSAVQTLSVRPIAAPVASLSLDARLLEIASVNSPGRACRFSHDGRRLTITFDPPLAPNQTSTITTNYTAIDPPQGLTWNPESPQWPGRAAQLHTQGQPETNSYWFPCHDFPNERMTTEIIATVPAGFLVSANGREAAPPRQGGNRSTFHWLQDKPHPAYLVSLVVGKFDVVSVAAGARTPMPVYAPPGRAADARRTYANTPRMTALFERVLEEPYPWDRYAQLVVWNFGAGGMENTSATTMHDHAVLDPRAMADADMDGLIAHELAHQWFGDLITCKSWEHIWLNEGFATYLTNLWFEERDGRDAYLAGILSGFEGLITNDKPDAPYQTPMVSPIYTDPWEVFRRPANPYPKGSSILHMLRRKLGDRIFFAGIAAYVNQHKQGLAETNDLRRALETASGENLEQFFRQWCFRPGVPSLDVETTYDRGARALTVIVRQMQPIDGPNPAFEFDLPIHVELPFADGARRGSVVTGVVSVRGRESVVTFPLEAEPGFVAVNPDLDVLAAITLKQPEAWLAAQVRRGPTVAARVAAARALADPSRADGGALPAVARDERVHERARAECIRSIAARGDATAFRPLLGEAIKDPDVRLALVESASAFAKNDAVAAVDRHAAKEFLARLAASGVDASDRVRAEAVRGLGRLRATEHLSLVLAAADAPSQGDRVRQAALEAMGDLDVADGLTVAIKYAAPGTLNRTRAVAVGVIARLAHHDSEAAFKALVWLLDDRERRAWTSAGEALAKIKDARAVVELERVAASKRDPADQKQLRRWAQSLAQ
ncbi:MAG: M1 family aminopeptidase [Phycisphaerales bacterium]